MAPRCLIALVLVLFACGCGSSGGSKPKGSGAQRAELGPSFDTIASLPGAQRSGPPWNSGAAKLQQRLKAIGLAPLPVEGNVVHIHQHLDIYVNGRHVTVPALIGIDPGHFFSPLHTHDTSGILHVESPTESAFSLGQFFAVWCVPLSARHPALLVEERAIGTDQARKFVLSLTESNTVEYRAVQLGPLIEGKRVVRSGLGDGDKIVVNGLQRVRPGMPVSPQEAVAQDEATRVAKR